MIERAPYVRREFLTVQALRAIAALVVVLFHALDGWRLRVDPSAAVWSNGSAGVDVFFVISGFVMLVSSGHLAGRAKGWQEFLWRRFVRIIPLYWLITTLKLVAVMLVPQEALHGRPPLANIVSSYLFLPSYDATGQILPVLPVGWTLSYEMLFYLLFAAALALRANILAVVAPVLGVLAVISPFRGEGWPAVTDLANTLELEFVAGLCLAMALQRGYRLDRRWAWFLLAAGAVAIATLPIGGRDLRVLCWGVPAFAIVAGAVSLETRLAAWLPRWLLFLGDASYAIYLVHFLITSGTAMLAAKLGLNGAAAEAAVCIWCLVGASLVGGAVHVLIERPLTEWLKRRRRPVPAEAPSLT